MPSESIHINFAIIGYVDRTKSTTTGHLALQGELEAPIPSVSNSPPLGQFAARVLKQMVAVGVKSGGKVTKA
ncbi:hypothetical protein GJAV_G00090210 [Gymnothorax javanicus]|nr:hypothetical protein GJAV_G00090210 [Gymnothorax javanicus]